MRLTGFEVQQARERLGGLSQEDLAELINTSQSKVSRWERRPDEKIEWIFSRRIRGLLRRARQGRPLRESAALPVHVIELQYPEGVSGPRVWVEDLRSRRQSRTETPPAPEAPSPPAEPASPSLGRAWAELWSPLFDALRWASVASLVLLVGCLVHADRPARAPPMPVHVPEQISLDNGKAELTEDGSIPMPSEPYPWQKRAPCDGKKGEKEKVGGCWWTGKDAHPPCPEYSVESAGECLMPVPAKPKRPSSSTPAKP